MRSGLIWRMQNDLNKFSKNSNHSVDFVFLLLLFASFGWVADSGSVFLKQALYILIFCLLLRRAFLCGVSFNASESLIRCFVLAIGFFVLGLHHNRIEEWLNIYKLVIVVFVLLTMSGKEFFGAFDATFKLVFLSAIVGWLFAMLNIGIKIPDFLATQERRNYYLTPLGSVFSEGQNFRAHGPFWEPGVLALYANLHLIMRILGFKEGYRNCWRNFILVLISGSVGGIVACLLIVATKKILNNILGQILFLVFSFVGIAVVGMFFFEVLEYFSVALNKFTMAFMGRDLSQDESFISRSMDLYVPFIAANERALMGWNSLDAFYYFSEAMAGYSARIITNSFGIISYFYGYPFLIIYLIGLAVGLSYFAFVIFPLGLILISPMLSSEPVQFSLIFMILFATSSQWNPKV